MFKYLDFGIPDKEIVPQLGMERMLAAKTHPSCEPYQGVAHGDKKRRDDDNQCGFSHFCWARNQMVGQLVAGGGRKPGLAWAVVSGPGALRSSC